MTVSTGTWTPAPNVFTYQWFRNGRALPGATGPALDLRSVTGLRLSDRLHAVVRASGIGSPAATSRSAAVAPPRAGLPPVWPVDDPRLVGKARVGRRLRAVLDRVPTDALVSYQWRVGGRLVAGARGQRLRLTRAHLGRRVQAVVTVVRNGEDRHRALTPRSRPVRR